MSLVMLGSIPIMAAWSKSSGERCVDKLSPKLDENHSFLAWKN